MAHERKPCVGCGGVKDRGDGAWYCTACLEARTRCIVCGESCVPGRRTCSEECLSEQRSSQGFRVMAVRPPRRRKPLPDQWTCSRCRRTKPLTVDYFNVERRDLETDEIIRYSRWCRLCKAEVARERYRQRTAEEIEQDRAYNRAMYELSKRDPAAMEKARALKREWQKRHPEKVAAAGRRYWERLRADPERRAKRLEADRITHALQVERETGEFPKRRYKTAANAYKLEVGGAACTAGKPVEPLALWMNTVLREDHRDTEVIADEMNMEARLLWRIQHREHSRVTTSLAERLLWRYGRAVRMPSAESIERELAERCRVLPGNGTRLLRYLDLAEMVAHLPGAVVDSVEDLWPELSEDAA